MLELAEYTCQLFNLDPKDYITFTPLDKTQRGESREVYKRVPNIMYARRVLNYDPKVTLLNGLSEYYPVKFYSSFERSPFDIESINDVLESGFVSRGPVNQKFEGILSDSLDSLPVLSNSGTSSLLTALYILTKGISNASVWTSQ